MNRRSAPGRRTSSSSCSTTSASPTSAATAPTSTRRTSTALAARGRALHELPHHRGVLADTGVPADRPQPPPRRHGDAPRHADQLSRVRGPHSARRGDAPADPARARLRDVLRRQMAPRAARRARRPAPTTSGRRRWGSTATTASSTARPTSGRRTSSATPTTSSRRGRPPTDTTSTKTSPTTRSPTSTSCASSHPERPFLLWYATAAPHAPHQAPPEWIEKFRGRFDRGWDEWRAATLRHQQALGVVEEQVELSARPPWIDGW